jgi:phytoene dehydrogenase-like protein
MGQDGTGRNGQYDAIVVGGGNNGLTAAAYLSKAGLRTVVLERRHMVGGAAVTEEICPGFRCSSLSYVCALLHPKVIEDLELERFGFAVRPIPGTFMLDGSGRELLLLTNDPEQQQRAIGRFSNSDYEATQRFHELVNEAAAVARGQWLREPTPLNGARWDDAGGLFRAFRDLKGTGATARQFFVRAMAGSAKQLIERWFSSEVMRLYQASHLVIGTYSHLDAPGSAISFIRHGVLSYGGKRRPWGIVPGGMGAITAAMAAFAKEKGCEIRVNAPVRTIIVENGAAVGVQLEDGAELRGRVVVANTDPRRTFLGMVGEANLPPEFAADMRGYRMGTASFKINLALKGLPRLGDGGADDIRHRTVVNLVDSWPAIEESYRAAIAGEVANPATVQIVIPSLFDETLAPVGQHVMSLACKYFPYDLSGGRSWDAVREETGDKVMTWCERFIPGLQSLVVGRQVITPLDMERTYGLTRGDIHHGRIDPDQIWNMRPHPDAAQYATPVKNLYLCGAGTHPGGGVSGVPGHNAARRILKDLRR